MLEASREPKQIEELSRQRCGSDVKMGSDAARPDARISLSPRQVPRALFLPKGSFEGR